MNFKARREKFMTNMAAMNIGTVLIQNSDSIYYLSGFNSAVSTRPFGLLLTSDREVLFTPTTAVDAAREEAPDMEVVAYYEYPAGEEINLITSATNSNTFHAALKAELLRGVSGKVIGAEVSRMSVADQAVLGELGFSVKDAGSYLMRMRSFKEADELEAIRVAAKYVDFINSATLKAMKQGITEIELTQAGVFALHKRISEELPSAEVSLFTMTTSGADRTFLPHTNTGTRKLSGRDFVILCRQVGVNVYRGQTDRMGFLGEPTTEQKKYYGIVLNAHEAAMEMIRSGIRVADIDKKIREIFDKEGLARYFVHRSGSGIGLAMAEPPYIRFDSDEIAETNMALIIQPALYVPSVGGFRCTDTVIVTDNGAEQITKHPRNIEALTVS